MPGCLKDLVRRIRIVVVRLVAGRRLFDLKQVGDRVLIVAPHPDDEVLGCAGLVQRLLSTGWQVDVVILSGGGRSHAGCCDIDETELIDRRRQLSRKAARIIDLPFGHLHFLDYPDGGISVESAETSKLGQLIADLSPNAIFVPHRGEGWSDHLEAGNIIRKLVADDTKVYEYCVWFWYYNVWNIDWHRVKVLKMSPEEHRKKLQAIDAYVTPLAPCGRPWSGVLPQVFVKANRWKCELYFETWK